MGGVRRACLRVNILGMDSESGRTLGYLNRNEQPKFQHQELPKQALFLVDQSHELSKDKTLKGLPSSTFRSHLQRHTDSGQSVMCHPLQRHQLWR